MAGEGGVTIEIPEGYPDLYAIVARSVYTALTERLKLPHELAEEIAFDASEDARLCIGGGSTYLPRGRFFESEQKKRAIRERYNGRNAWELARDLNVSLKYVQRLVRQFYEAQRATQGDMFGATQRSSNPPK